VARMTVAASQDTVRPPMSYKPARLLAAPLARLAYRRHGIEGVNAALLRRTVNVEELLRQYGAVVYGPGVIHGPLVIHNADRDYSNLFIGDNAHIGRGVTLDLADLVTLGHDVTISMGATLLTHTDVGDRPLSDRLQPVREALRVGDGAYVGANATILPGCHIGREAIVAAGAVVTRPVGDGEKVGGVPARPLH
jgi:acetyltransferase-like isoleucine patch superfamily enzyme